MRVEYPVHEPGHIAHPRWVVDEVAGDGAREDQHTGCKDQRDHAGRVDPQRHVRALATDDHQPVATHSPDTLAILHRDAALPFLDDHDHRHGQHRHDGKDQELDKATLDAVFRTLAGMPAMMPPKMIIETPLPIPSSVMIWPNHMAIIVPAVKRQDDARSLPADTVLKPNSVTTGPGLGRIGRGQQRSLAKSLQRGQRDGQKIGILVELLPAGLAFFAQRFKLRE